MSWDIRHPHTTSTARALKKSQYILMQCFFGEISPPHYNGEGKRFSLEELTSIKCCLQFGVKMKEITARLGHSERGVRRQVRRLKCLKFLLQNASPLLPKASTWHPTTISMTQDERLTRNVRYVLKNPFKSARELKNEVHGKSNVCVRTIQHRLQKKLGLVQEWVHCYGLAWQLSRPQPHRNLLVLHEEEAQGGQHHHFLYEASGGHQEHVDQGDGQPILQEPRRLYT